MKESTTKSKSGPWGVYVKITGLLLIINIIFALGGAFVAYPTEAHRDTTRRLSDMSSKAVLDDGKTPYYESSEYKALSDSPEARYVTTASIVTGVAGFVLTVAEVGFVYNYLRKNHITKSRKELGVTIAVNLVASVAAQLATIPAASAIAGTAPPTPAALFFMVAIFTIVGTLVLLIITSVFQWRYDRKYSMSVE